MAERKEHGSTPSSHLLEGATVHLHPTISSEFAQTVVDDRIRRAEAVRLGRSARRVRGLRSWLQRPAQGRRAARLRPELPAAGGSALMPRR